MGLGEPRLGSALVLAWLSVDCGAFCPDHAESAICNTRPRLPAGDSMAARRACSAPRSGSSRGARAWRSGLPDHDNILVEAARGLDHSVDDNAGHAGYSRLSPRDIAFSRYIARG